jgi:hypothetical protein
MWKARKHTHTHTHTRKYSRTETHSCRDTCRSEQAEAGRHRQQSKCRRSHNLTDRHVFGSWNRVIGLEGLHVSILERRPPASMVCINTRVRNSPKYSFLCAVQTFLWLRQERASECSAQDRSGKTRWYSSAREQGQSTLDGVD